MEIRLLNKDIYEIANFIEGTCINVKEIKFINTNKSRLAILKYTESFESKVNARSIRIRK